MYTFRRQIIKEFRKKKIPLEVAGKDWDKSLFRNIVNFYRILFFNINSIEIKKIIWFPRSLFGIKKGKSIEIKSKQKFLASIKFCIIVENSLDYVSEKIFDCFRAGVVPIYVGPSLIDFGIPPNTVIVAPNDIDKFFSIVNSIDDFPINDILKRGEMFLKSKSSVWTETISLKNIANKIIDIIENRNE
jgi:hypothetical protein